MFVLSWECATAEDFGLGFAKGLRSVCGDPGGLVRVLDAGALADAELEIGAAERAHAIAEERRFAPEAELRALLDDPEPAPGVDGERAQAHMREELGLQVERLMEERREDPAAYVMGQPAVAEAFAAAEQDPTLLPDAIARRLAAQEALGIKPEDRRALTKSEASELIQSLQALPLEQQAAAVAELRDTYGAYSGRLAAELEEAGLPRLLALVLDPSSDPALAHRFVTLLNPDGPESLRDLPESGITNDTTKQFLPEEEAAQNGNEVERPNGLNLRTPPFPPQRNPRRSQGGSSLMAEGDPSGAAREDGVPPSPETTTSDRGDMDQVMAGGAGDGRQADDLSPTGEALAAPDADVGEDEEESFLDSLSLRAAVRKAPFDPTFDPFRNLPELPGSPREQAEKLFKAMGLTVYVPEGEDGLTLLDIARDLWSLRHRFEAQGPIVLTQFQEKVRDFSRRATAKRYHERNPNAVYGGLGVFAEAVIRNPERYFWSLSDNELDHLYERLTDLTDLYEGGALAAGIVSTALPAFGKKVMQFVPAAEAVDTVVSQVSGDFTQKLSLAYKELVRRGIPIPPPYSRRKYLEKTGITPVSRPN